MSGNEDVRNCKITKYISYFGLLKVCSTTYWSDKDIASYFFINFAL